MDLYAALMMALGALFVVGALAGIVVGIRRMQGKRSRFDRFFETVARAEAAGVYPPSLRGNPDPQVQEDVEVSRGDAAVRSTPNDVVRRRRPRGVHTRTSVSR